MQKMQPRASEADLPHGSTVTLPSLNDCALLLDIDGTLLDLAPEPDAVVVPDGLRASLQRLLDRTEGALALVSGRAIENIDRIFAPLCLPAVGGHGAETRPTCSEGASVSSIRPMDEKLRKRFAAIAALDSGILVEDKGYSIALHFRRAPDKEAAIYKAVSAIRSDLPQAAIEVLPGKQVCEIKPAGFSKATAVRALLTLPPFTGRVPVFLGDDVTDETVFAIMPDLNGFAFSVGRKARGVAGHFEDPTAVRHWLAQRADA